MRLLDARDLKLCDFDSPPPYAILSHRWSSDEVSYDDILASRAKSRKGFAKLRKCCKLALSEGYAYVWIDTCCINKSSSSELSEAINSMYFWYKQSEVCFAYLMDVDGKEDPSAEGSSFSRSVWFKRGWTLQELIAPASVVFFASDWSEIGTKTTLAEAIVRITNIDQTVLARNSSDEVSVARRMSWAAGRETTRVEDRAYSLMGIFGVNMPTLYGEGERAFIRLQQEILKVSNDHSIFAWDNLNATNPGYPVSGLLAASPSQFARSSEYEHIKYPDFMKMFGITTPKADYALTNFGIRIQLPTMSAGEQNKGIVFAHLACRLRGGGSCTTCILLQQQADLPPGHYVRLLVDKQLFPSGKVDESEKVTIEDIFVSEHDPSSYDALDSSDISTDNVYRILVMIPGHEELAISSLFPKEKWIQDSTSLILDIGRSGTYGCVVWKNERTGESFGAVLGVHNWRVWSDICVAPDSAEDLFKAYAYDDNTMMGRYRWKGIDRVKKTLGSDGRTVVLTIKREASRDKKIDLAAVIRVVSAENQLALPLKRILKFRSIIRDLIVYMWRTIESYYHRK